MNKCTRLGIETAVAELAKWVNHNLAVEFENRKARIIAPCSIDNCPDHTGGYSVPFGYTFYTYDVLYDMVWFAIRVVNMVK